MDIDSTTSETEETNPGFGRTARDLSQAAGVDRHTAGEWIRRPGFPYEADGTFNFYKVYYFVHGLELPAVDMEAELEQRVTDLITSLQQIGEQVAADLPKRHQKSVRESIEGRIQSAIVEAFQGGRDYFFDGSID